METIRAEKDVYMFNLPDSLLILVALFGLFMPFETGVSRYVSVGVSIRIEDSDIHEHFLIPGAQKPHAL